VVGAAGCEVCCCWLCDLCLGGDDVFIMVQLSDGFWDWLVGLLDREV
jgi:hypothetical protein